MGIFAAAKEVRWILVYRSGNNTVRCVAVILDPKMNASIASGYARRLA